MILTASVDALLEETPPFSNVIHPSLQPILLGFALAAWVLGEALMAPVLQPFIMGLWLGYTACFFIFTAWYFRLSRLFNTAWTSYKQSLAPMIWTLTPLHLLFPAALILSHSGAAGLWGYEIIKAGVILAVLSRLMQVIQVLNHWPRWSAVGLALSPLALAFVVMITFLALGSLAIVALGLKAVLTY